MQLQHRLASAEAARTVSAGAFDRLRDGAIFVDTTFRILFANRSAKEILADADGLRRAPDGIAAASTGETETLRRLIAGEAAPTGMASRRQADATI